MSKQQIILYYYPQTRSTGVRILLEELGVQHRLEIVNLRKKEQKQPAFLAINPMGKIPAIVHNGEVITEQVAIYIYLTDLFAGKSLAPIPGQQGRGAYLRWLVFYGTCFEPAIIDQALQRMPSKPAMTPYGNFATMIDVLTTQLSSFEYIAGENFTAADILWASSFCWMNKFNLVPKIAILDDYIQRIEMRPIVQKIMADDIKMAKELAEME